MKKSAVISKVRRRRAIAKALSWRIIGSLDTLLLSFAILTVLGPVFGIEGRSHVDNAKAATLIAATEMVTKIILYYLHERAWERSHWGVVTDRRGRPHDNRRRSVTKTTTWRGIASLDTVLLALLFTGNLGAAFSIGGLEVLTKLVLYYVHERVWDRISWA